MLELMDKIFELAKVAEWEIDRTDIGCTITNAMKKVQIDDLKAMISFLESKGDSPSSILVNAMHDLNGLKAIYFGLPEGNCFSPRSSGYAKKAS
jgi:hypothetical protein